MIAIEVLIELERRLGERHGDPQHGLCRHVDLAVSTRGGAIIGAAVALGIAMTDIRDFELHLATNIFLPARWWRKRYCWYDKDPLQNNLIARFGRQTTLASARLSTLLLLLVMRNCSTDLPLLVSNNPHARYNDSERDDNLQLPLWQLARASAAAPA